MNILKKMFILRIKEKKNVSKSVKKKSVSIVLENKCITIKARLMDLILSTPVDEIFVN